MSSNVTPLTVKPSPFSLRHKTKSANMEGKPCTPGHTEYRDHCIPADGEHGDRQSHSDAPEQPKLKKGKLKLYRGIGQGSDDSGFEWFSETPKLAERYADHRGGKVESAHVSIEHPLEVLNPKAVLDAHSFFANAMKQVDMSRVDKKQAMQAREEFLDHFGEQSIEVMDYWSNPEAKKATRNLLLALGFDSIAMQEGGEQTYASLNKEQIEKEISPEQKRKQRIDGFIREKIGSGLQRDAVLREEFPDSEKEAKTKAIQKVLEFMPDKAINMMEANVEKFKFYITAGMLTQALYGAPTVKGGVTLGAFEYDTDTHKGTLHLDGGENTTALNDVESMRQVYAHEFSHTIDWINSSQEEEPVYRLAVDEAQAAKVIAERLKATMKPGRNLDAEISMLEAGILSDYYYYAAMGIDVSDLYKVIGHRTIGIKGHPISSTEEWRIAYREEIASRKDGTYPLSKYATTNISESFAEFGRLAWTNPKDAKTSFPKSWAIWKKHGLV